MFGLGCCGESRWPFAMAMVLLAGVSGFITRLAVESFKTDDMQTSVSFKTNANDITSKVNQVADNLNSKERWCSPKEVLASPDNLVRMTEALAGFKLRPRRYNKACPYIRSSYKCSGSKEYSNFLANDTNRQVPIAFAKGKCKLYNGEIEQKAIGEQNAQETQRIFPFPSGTSVLFWGNSHLRELITAINCQYDAPSSVYGTNQDTVCRFSDYSLKEGQSEILFRNKYSNNAKAYGACNCGLMYDRANAFQNIGKLLDIDYSKLTHVVANPANVAKWAVQLKFAKCKDEHWHQQLANLSNYEQWKWNPFPTPQSLKEALTKVGFQGKLIWTLPFWCRNKTQSNIYRWTPEKGLLENKIVDAFLDTSQYICDGSRHDFRCQVGLHHFVTFF